MNMRPKKPKPPIEPTTPDQSLDDLLRSLEQHASTLDGAYYHCECCGSKRFRNFNQRILQEKLMRSAQQIREAMDHGK